MPDNNCTTSTQQYSGQNQSTAQDCSEEELNEAILNSEYEELVTLQHQLNDRIEQPLDPAKQSVEPNYLSYRTQSAKLLSSMIGKMNGPQITALQRKIVQEMSNHYQKVKARTGSQAFNKNDEPESKRRRHNLLSTSNTLEPGQDVIVISDNDNTLRPAESTKRTASLPSERLISQTDVIEILSDEEEACTSERAKEDKNHIKRNKIKIIDPPVNPDTLKIGEVKCLGDLLSEKVYRFDNQLIDDSLLHKERAPHRLAGTKLEQANKRILERQHAFHVCKALVYCYLISSEGLNMQEMRKIACKDQPASNDEILYNLVAGYTQIGKTKSQVATSYMTALGTGRICINFARNSGGGEDMLALEKDIRELEDVCRTYLEHMIKKYRCLKCLTPADLATVFSVKVVQSVHFHREYEADCKGMKTGRSSHWTKPEKLFQLGDMKCGGLIILSRMNPFSIHRLFNSHMCKPASINTSEYTFYKVLRNYMKKNKMASSSLIRVAFIIDEDDTNAASVGRNRNQTEISTHAELIDLTKEDGHDEEETNRNEASEKDVNLDEFLEQAPNLGDIPLICRIDMVLGYTATWFPLLIVDPNKAKFRQKVNVIPMEVKDNYTGFAFLNQPPMNRKLPVQIHTVSELEYYTRGSEYKRHLPILKDIFQKLSYEHAQTEARGFDPRNAHLRQYVSMLISTSKTTYTEPQDTMAKKITKLLSQGLQNVIVPREVFVFPYNSRYESFYITKSLVDNLVKKRIASMRATESKPTAKRVLLEIAESVVQPENRRNGASWFYVEKSKYYYTVTMQACKPKRFIQRIYDLAFRLFEEAGKLPFVICVSGIMAGRALRMKDSAHKYPLTDQYTECGEKWDCSKLLQVCGRVTSLDPYHHLIRRLWCPSFTKCRLDMVIKFDQEARQLYSEMKEPIDFLAALREVTESKYPNIYDSLVGNLGPVFTRSIQDDPFLDKISDIVQNNTVNENGQQNYIIRKPIYFKLDKPSISCDDNIQNISLYKNFMKSQAVERIDDRFHLVRDVQDREALATLLESIITPRNKKMIKCAATYIRKSKHRINVAQNLIENGETTSKTPPTETYFNTGSFMTGNEKLCSGVRIGDWFIDIVDPVNPSTIKSAEKLKWFKKSKELNGVEVPTASQRFGKDAEGLILFYEKEVKWKVNEGVGSSGFNVFLMSISLPAS